MVVRKIGKDISIECNNRLCGFRMFPNWESGEVKYKENLLKVPEWCMREYERIEVAGHGLIQERNIHTNEMVEFEVSGDKIEAIHMIPGWTHNIINLSETENLVTVMTCNEIFDPSHPDAFGEPV